MAAHCAKLGGSGQRVAMKCESVRSSSSKCQLPLSASHPASKQRGAMPAGIVGARSR
jgi:hypothetical protein